MSALTGRARLRALGLFTRAHLLEFFREPGILFWAFGFPILLSWALGLAFLALVHARGGCRSSRRGLGKDSGRTQGQQAGRNRGAEFHDGFLWVGLGDQRRRRAGTTAATDRPPTPAM